MYEDDFNISLKTSYNFNFIMCIAKYVKEIGDAGILESLYEKIDINAIDDHGNIK